MFVSRSSGKQHLRHLWSLELMKGVIFYPEYIMDDISVCFA